MENQGFLVIGSLQVSTSLKMTCVYHHSPALFTGTGFLMFRWREPLLLTPLPTSSDIRVLKPLINCQFLPPLSAPPSSPAQKRSGFIIVTCGFVLTPFLALRQQRCPVCLPQAALDPRSDLDIFCVHFVLLPLPQMAVTFPRVTCRCSHCGMAGKPQCWYQQV